MKAKKSIVLVCSIFLVCAACNRGGLDGNGTTGGSGGTGSTLAMDAAHQQYFNTTSAAITQAKAQVDSQVASGQLHPGKIGFDADLFFAQGAFIPHSSVSVMDNYVDALKASGATRISINMDSTSYFLKTDAASQNIVSMYDQVISHIRQDGLQLILSPESEVKNPSITSFGQFQSAAIPVYAEMAKRYQPDVFNVIHEPYTLEKWGGFTMTAAQASSFVSAAAQTVKQNSPNTQIGVYGQWFDYAFMPTLISNSSVNVVGIDIYDLAHMPAQQAYIDQAKKLGKPLYLAETGRPPFKSGSFNVADILQDNGNGQFGPIDQQWLDFVADYASAQGFTSIDPFWTTTYFYYGYPPAPDSVSNGQYDSSIATALQNGQHTATYDEVVKLKQQYGN